MKLPRNVAEEFTVLAAFAEPRSEAFADLPWRVAFVARELLLALPVTLVVE